MKKHDDKVEEKEIKNEEATENEEKVVEEVNEDKNHNSSGDDRKVEELENQMNDCKDKLLRKAAEFENYKRRKEAELSNYFKYAAEDFIISMLPVVDDFERSLQHFDNAKDPASMKEGVKMIYDKMMKVFNEQGVKKIESKGKPFDVDFHDALLQQKAEGVDPHTVIEEVETGWLYKDKVIRHAKVIVSEAAED